MSKPLDRQPKKRVVRGRFVLRAFVDMIGILAPFREQAVPAVAGGKRILVFNWRDTRHKHAGGAEVYIHELAKRWVRDGNYVTLFCGSDGSGEAPREELMDGIHVIRRGGFNMVYVWAFFYYIFRFRRRYDIIVDCHNGIPFFAPLYAREPVVGVVHHIHQEVFKQHLSRPKAALAMFLEAKLMPRAYHQSQLIAVSPSTKQAMQELGVHGQGDIEIVYNGVDLGVLRPGTKEDHPTILFLGRLAAYKSVDVLIQAFQSIKEHVPTAHLVIAGSGDAADSLRRLAKRHHLGSDAITFTGKVSEANKISLLQRAWVAVNPSQMEGWGITTIEANACGTPVVGADVPGLRDSIRHRATGLLVPHGQPDILAAHLTEFLQNHSLRTSLSHSAREWAQQFDWEVSAEEMMNIMGRAEKRKKLAAINAVL